MLYFGTDGIRGIVGEKLNEKLLIKISKAVVKFYEVHKLKKVLLVGNDTRISSDYILSVMQTILLAHGIEIHNVGVCSTPCLSFITQKFNYPLSMMISASHNSSEYNGIKFFNSKGEKLLVSTENEIESYMNTKLKKNLNFAKVKTSEDLKFYYIKYIKSLIIGKTNAVFDCSNGGSSFLTKKVFPKNKTINSLPNGRNINDNAGCTHIEQLKSICVKQHCVGFAFDGDGDRVLCVDETGNLIDGAKILYILSKFYLNFNDTLVGTINTNEGLNIALKKRKIKFVRADVGDRNVYQEMIKNDAILGGEDCGHIVFKKYMNTGDGLLTATILNNILASTKLNFSELLTGYTELHQEQANIKLTEHFDINKIRNIMLKLEKEGSRMVVRPSGTEPVLRVIVENIDPKTAKSHLQILKNEIMKF